MIRMRAIDGAVIHCTATNSSLPDMMVAIKPLHSNLPTVGNFRYEGVQTTNTKTGNSPGSIGFFALDVNFANDSFNYNGNSGSVTVTGAGALDAANGRFASNTLSMTANSTQHTGTMHGLISGNGGSSPLDMFHTNYSLADHTGAFYGFKN